MKLASWMAFLLIVHSGLVSWSSVFVAATCAEEERWLFDDGFNDDMLPSKVIVALLFHDFELLDYFGPMQMFKVANQLLQERGSAHLYYSLRTVSWWGGSVDSSGGPQVVTEEAVSTLAAEGRSWCSPNDLADCTLFVPGGAGTRGLVRDARLVSWLRAEGAQVGRVCSVCTGAALLARAGLLDGLNATTNKAAWNEVTSKKFTGTAAVNWVKEARWVKASKAGRSIWSSSGVSAGMDMALAMIAEDLGQELAEQTAARVEYVWNQDPALDSFSYLADQVEPARSRSAPPSRPAQRKRESTENTGTGPGIAM